MTLLTAQPKSGRTVHIYERDGDGKSICGRAPLTAINWDFEYSRITCDKCKRAYDIMMRLDPQPVKKKESGPKSTPTKTARSSSSAVARTKSSKSSKRSSK